MGKSAGSNVSTSSTSYPAWQLPAVQDFVQKAQSQYAQGGPQLSPDSRVAPFNASELQAQQQLRDSITPVTELADWGQKAAAFNLGPGRDPTSNPYLQSAISSATQPITDQLLQQILPSIRNQSVLSGTTGSSRQGIAEGLATQGALRTAGDITAQMSNAGYQNAQQLAFNTMGILPQLQQNWTMPAQLMSSIGMQERALQEAILNENANRYEYEQRLPYANLAEFGNMIRQPFGSEATSTATVPPPSVASQIAGGVLSLPALAQVLRELFRIN